MNQDLLGVLVERTNRIDVRLSEFDATLSADPERAAESRRLALVDACAIAGNGALVAALVADSRTLEARATAHAGDVRAVLSSDHFGFFIETERRALAAANVSSSVQNTIVAKCVSVRQEVLDGTLMPLALEHALDDLRQHVCAAMQQLLASEERQRAAAKRASGGRRRLHAGYLILLGCVLVGADVGAAAFLSPAGSAVSGLLGNVIAGLGSHQLID